MNPRRLYRSSTDRVLGGVAAGTAEYFDLDPALVRVAWALLVLGTAGVFLVLYIVMWIVVPEAPPGYLPGHAWDPGAQVPPSAASRAGGGSPDDHGPVPPTPATPTSIADDWAARRAARRRRRSGEGGVIIGAILVLVGIWFLARDYLPWLNGAEIWPILIILVGVVLLVGALRPRPE